MALELRDCTFNGPALPEPFVKFQLERELSKRNLLAKTTGAEGRTLEDRWDVFRRKLRQLGEQGGDRRVANHVLEPLVERLGYSALERQAEVITREGAEDGGWLFITAEGQRLRAWTVSLGTDLDAPNRRGRAYRFSPSRVAQRVLLASGERMGLLSDGEELRILLCDPARPDSHISIRLDRAGGWRAARALPDSYRLLLALASPAGVAALPELTEAARLAQSSVTKKLRLQARRAIEGFLQEVLEHPANAQALADRSDRQQLAQQLWSEGLITVYRLLFVFKLESSADPARAFSFAATSLWRNTYSPNTALAHWVRRVLDEGKDSGGFLEAGLRTLWRLFAEGMSSSELEIKPLGGMLFGRDATPLLGQLQWGEQAVARLLDALLWTPGEGVTMRERVHYGALDVEDLGRVYESLLELEPGISSEPMCRLRRAKLEVVVPVAQGGPYRSNPVQASDPEESGEDEEEGDEDESAPTRGRAASGSKTKVEFIEEIAADRFFLRVGLGRKASGSYYTPHPFVRFLVQETLGVLLAECSPRDNPQPLLILKLKVLDAAMGSGHFLVEACRFLGEGLYEACRLCDELAVQAEEQAEKTEGAERETLLAKAAELRKRVEDLPDPNNELLAYLPSRAAEGEESGLSQKKAEAMCRRLVAVHCLYGVDKNPLAVELAKLSLWLESYAEGLPLTFLDHRLICGDSLTGPFFEHLLTYPKSGGRLDDLFAQGLTHRLQNTLTAALGHVRDLEASVGKDLADLHLKESAKAKLDAALTPLKTLSAAWSGGVMLGDACDDAGYQILAQAVAREENLKPVIQSRPGLELMLRLGASAIAYPLTFPEVFYRGDTEVKGFDAVLGNPPWDKIRNEHEAPLLASSRDSASTEDQTDSHGQENENQPSPATQYRRSWTRLSSNDTLLLSAVPGNANWDIYRLFLARNIGLGRQSACIGQVLPGGLIKNPADKELRVECFARRYPEKIMHFINTKQLFDSLPPVIEFSLIVFSGKKRSALAQVGMNFDGFPGNDYRSMDASDIEAVRLHVRKTSNIVDMGQTGEEFELVTLGTLLRSNNILLADELNSTTDRDSGAIISMEEMDDTRLWSLRIELLARDLAPCYAGRCIDHFNDLPLERSGRWLPSTDQVVNLAHPRSSQLVRRLSYFRLYLKKTVGSPSTNERSVKAVLASPGGSGANSLLMESTPWERPNWKALTATAILNSFALDADARQHIQSNFNLAIMNEISLPRILDMPSASFLAHMALRLTCNHPGYSNLWDEQLGSEWRERGTSRIWPILSVQGDRWAGRAKIDVVVAHAYGIDRDRYERMLSLFAHRSFPRSQYMCLEAFDELSDIGLEAFIKRHDPYWDIPLNVNLPQPILELGISDQVGMVEASMGPLFASSSVAASPAKSVQATAPPYAGRPSRTPSPADRTSSNGAFTTIAELLRSRGVITSSDAQQATGLDAAGVRPHLQQLVQQGLAVTEGQRRGMRYRRVDG
jgi:hypothetical protein